MVLIGNFIPSPVPLHIFLVAQGLFVEGRSDQSSPVPISTATEEPRKRPSMMERPSYMAALSVPTLRQQMVEVSGVPEGSRHVADVLVERYLLRDCR